MACTFGPFTAAQAGNVNRMCVMPAYEAYKAYCDQIGAKPLLRHEWRLSLNALGVSVFRFQGHSQLTQSMAVA